MQDSPGPSGTGRKNVANEANEEQEFLTSLLNPCTPTLPDTSEDDSAYSESAYTATTKIDSSMDTRARRRNKNKKKKNNNESKEH